MRFPYGSTNYGMEAASQSYFHKSAKDLDLAESATLAAMIQAPFSLPEQSQRFARPPRSGFKINV